MVSNFEFLRKYEKLFNIANEAEKLYRDGYFEQVAIQTRKFGEIAAKNILGVRRTTEETFDEILATLSDILGENQKDKELIDDLYFLKKQGNLAAHGSARELSAMDALECLKRAFEVSVNFAIKNGFANKKILTARYNVDTLMTGKKSKIPDIVEEETDFEKKSEEKVVKADFKKKRKIKEPSKPSKQKNVKSVQKKVCQKKETVKKTFSADNLLYLIVFGILFVFFISIMLFILPL